MDFSSFHSCVAGTRDIGGAGLWGRSREGERAAFLLVPAFLSQCFQCFSAPYEKFKDLREPQNLRSALDAPLPLQGACLNVCVHGCPALSPSSSGRLKTKTPLMIENLGTRGHTLFLLRRPRGLPLSLSSASALVLGDPLQGRILDGQDTGIGSPYPARPHLARGDARRL